MLTGPFWGTEALAAGLLSHNGLYGPRFQRLFSGVFAPADPVVDCGDHGRAGPPRPLPTHRPGDPAPRVNPAPRVTPAAR